MSSIKNDHQHSTKYLAGISESDNNLSWIFNDIEKLIETRKINKKVSNTLNEYLWKLNLTEEEIIELNWQV